MSAEGWVPPGGVSKVRAVFQWGATVPMVSAGRSEGDRGSAVVAPSHGPMSNTLCVGPDVDLRDEIQVKSLIINSQIL
jgi:hypothetical protein